MSRVDTLKEFIRSFRIVNWTEKHPVNVALVVIIAVGFNIAYNTQPSIPTDGSEPGLIFSIFEIIALIIPAFAILLQAILRLTKSKPFIFIGKSTEIRRWSFLIVGFSSFILGFIILVLSRLLILPKSLDTALFLLAIVILGFGLIPVYIASIAWIEGYEEFAKGIGQFELVADLEPVLDNPDKMLTDVLEMHGLDHLIEETAFESTENQTTLEESMRKVDEGQ